MTRLKDQRRWTTRKQIATVVATRRSPSRAALSRHRVNASYPGTVGRLALARPDAVGFDQIRVAGADLSGAVQVTAGEFGSNHPDWPRVAPGSRSIPTARGRSATSSR